MPTVNAPQYTLQYKTFVKRAMLEALQAAFNNHPDSMVASTKVALSYNDDDFKLPAVVVNFIEGPLTNAGVGHFEWGADPDNPDVLVMFQHRNYKGTVEFEIWAMDTLDEAVISDALIEVLAMDEASLPGQGFLSVMFNNRMNIPYAGSHFATLNFDNIDSTGERQLPAPWMEEDQLVHQNAYRIAIFGEFYSYVPPTPRSYGPITEVDVYGYPTGQDKVTPIDPLDQAPPNEPETDWMHITGTPPGTKDV